MESPDPNLLPLAGSAGAGGVTGVGHSEAIDPVRDSYDVVDSYMARAAQESQRLGRPVRCEGPGCYFCCKEPVHADRIEVGYMLKHYQGDKAQLAKRTFEWGEKFFGAGLDSMPVPKEINGFGWLIRYRAANAWCPFLVDGKCSAYEHRPASCRIHAVIGSPKRCADDKLRLKQKFMTTDIQNDVLIQSMGAMVQNAPVAVFELDHIGIWLGELLLGSTKRSAAAVTLIVKQTQP